MNLVSILIISLVLFTLSLGMFNQTFLANRETNYFVVKNSSLVAAENSLLKKEQAILSNHVPSDAKLIDSECGVSYYEVSAKSERGLAKTELRSTVALVSDVDNCHPKPKIKSGVKSYWEVW